MKNLLTLQEVKLELASGGTFSCPIPAGSAFTWPDDGQAASMVSHGWAKYADAVEPEIAAGNEATQVPGIHPPHPQGQVAE